MFSRTKLQTANDIAYELRLREARKSFWAYRRFMWPKMKIGWWQREVARELQDFYDQLVAKQRPMMVIEAPPQHGKSDQINDFQAWVSGKHPELRQIYGSFSERLGVRANLRMQRVMDTHKYRDIFPETRLVLPKTQGGSVLDANFIRSRELLEFVGQTGYFRNTTVQGSVTGESLDLGVIDDPIKGRAEANSENNRDKAWDWLTDDFFTRFSDEAGLLIILTRWHVDDPVGRLKDKYPELKVLKYPAIAIEDEKYRKKGEPLFPEHKSLEFLMARKKVLSADSFEALYQQSPYLRTGNTFPIDKFQILERAPSRADIAKSVRYWDKAGTKDGDGAETSGTLMHKMKDGTYVIEHVAHGRWAALERERMIKTWAETDGFWVQVFVEQEPGSGGKESAESTIRNLAGFVVAADRPTGDKVIRAEPYAAQVQGGNFWLVRGDWNKPFLDEHEAFPNGKLKDMVDSSSGAFNKIAGASYDMEVLSE